MVVNAVCGEPVSIGLGASSGIPYYLTAIWPAKAFGFL
jgi:hypothetical protein